ncbi:uncharacterized protein [Rutidosis leptorrhynchoides]|uniref:uncharacterized protein n=1 Tax=Rutidosis leptorrhynchoides TaxID=125765 RepID=UPI003A9983D9
MSFNIRTFSGTGKEGSKIGWFKRLRIKESPDIVLLQETKCNSVNNSWIEQIWGSPNFKFIQKPKVGKSGGMLIIWDPTRFDVNEAVEKHNLLAIKGKWTGKDRESIVVNVYGPHTDEEKKKMWVSLEQLMQYSNEVEWVLGGDFNEVRYQEERKNCKFIESRAKLFNSFIENSQLIEIPLLGKRFTRISDNGTKFSKLDRFLVNDLFLQTWGDVAAIALDRGTSDHSPIVIRVSDVDFGPKLFKLFDLWLESKEVEKIVIDAWNSEVFGFKEDCRFRDKLKRVKEALRIWSKSKYGALDREIESLKTETMLLEEKADSGNLSEVEKEN